jgi:hypothetical protein
MAVEIPLNHGFVAVVDDEDYPLVAGSKWSVTRAHGLPPHAQATRGGRRVLMHRLILGCERGVLVDHIDGDGLNNRRGNLRLGTPTLNMQNRRGPARNSKTGVRGVYRHKSSGLYCATVIVDGRRGFEGYFKTLEEADAAVRAARARLMPFSAEAREKVSA